MHTFLKQLPQMLIIIIMIKWTLVPTEFLYSFLQHIVTLRNRPTTTGTTYTHVRSHRCMHACMHAHTHKYIQTHTHACTCMRTHARMLTCTCACTHISRPFEEHLWDDLKDENAIDELTLQKEVCWRLSNGGMVPYGWADFTEGSLLKAK